MILRKSGQDTQPHQPVVLWIIGSISGILMGLFGMGTLLAAYINRNAKERSDFRGNLCCVFVVDNLFRIFGYWYRAILTGSIIKYTLLLVPAVIAGMWLSGIADLHLSEDRIRMSILIILVISGVFLIINNAHS